MAQWTEHQPANQRVTSLIPSQVTGLQARSPAGGVRDATDQCFSPSLSPSLPLSIKINKILKHKEEDYKNIKVVVIMFLFKLYVSVLSIAPLWKMMTITSYLLFSTLTSSLFAPNFYLYYYFYIFITYFYIFYKVIL